MTKYKDALPFLQKTLERLNKQSDKLYKDINLNRECTEQTHRRICEITYNIKLGSKVSVILNKKEYTGILVEYMYIHEREQGYTAIVEMPYRKTAKKTTRTKALSIYGKELETLKQIKYGK